MPGTESADAAAPSRMPSGYAAIWALFTDWCAVTGHVNLPAGPGVRVYRPDVPDFVLAVVEPESEEPARVALHGPAIAIATEGSLSLEGAEGSVRVERGGSVFVTPSEGALAVTGRGTLFVATV